MATDDTRQRAWEAYAREQGFIWLPDAVFDSTRQIREAYLAGYDAATKERNEHIFDLYHGLNLSLPSYRGMEEMTRVLPESFEHFQAGDWAMDTHHDCCGHLYDDLIQDGIFARGLERDGGAGDTTAPDQS